MTTKIAWVNCKFCANFCCQLIKNRLYNYSCKFLLKMPNCEIWNKVITFGNASIKIVFGNHYFIKK